MNLNGQMTHSPASAGMYESSLLPILCGYAALVPTKNLSLPPDVPFNVAHNFFLREILLNHHLKQYPPSESYQQTFWKWAVEQLENLSRDDEDHEIDECIYAHYLSLRAGAHSGTPPDSYLTHYWRSSTFETHPMVESYDTITLLESRTTIEAGTTGLRTWRASLILAQYLIQHANLVENHSVLELGSGTGFIGILVGSLQLHAATPTTEPRVPSIYLTDVNSTVLVRCQSNVQLPCNKSSSHPNMYYKSLDWHDSLSSPENLTWFFSEAKADIILAADVVFDPLLVPPLIGTLALALPSGQTRLAFIALTVRNVETLTYFLAESRKVLTVEEIQYEVTGNLLLRVADQVDAGLEVKIFKITRPRDGSSSKELASTQSNTTPDNGRF